MGEKRGSQIAGIIAALVGATAWGFSGTCIQFLFATTTIDPLLLTTIRQLGAGIILLAIFVIGRREALTSMLSDATARRRLLVFGAFGLFLNSAMYATAVSFTNAGTATVLQSLNIVMVLIVSCLAGRKLPRGREVVALVCALAATFLIATHGDPATLKMPVAGLVTGILTAATATFYTMYPKPLFERYESFAVTGVGMFVGGVTGLAINVANGTIPSGLPELNTLSVGILAVSVVIGTVVAYGLFLHGISIVGPLWGNMLGAAEPVSATVIAAVWLGTAFSWADWAGLVLMVATIALVSLQPNGKDGEKKQPQDK